MNRIIALLVVYLAFSPPNFAENQDTNPNLLYGINVNSDLSPCIKDSFFRKIKLILDNKEKLQLSEPQINLICECRQNITAELIRTKSEIEDMETEIAKNMDTKKINADRINILIEKKYNIISKQNQSIAAAYAKIFNSVSGDQKKKMLSLFESATPSPSFFIDSKTRKRGYVF